jgi:hypothetical protein
MSPWPRSGPVAATKAALVRFGEATVVTVSSASIAPIPLTHSSAPARLSKRSQPER